MPNKDVAYNVSIPFMMFSRTGEAVGPTMPKSWSENVGQLGVQSLVGRVQCGGYEGSFEQKLSHSKLKLVTGPMVVDVTERRITRGYMRRGVMGPNPNSVSYHSYDDAGRWGSVSLDAFTATEESSIVTATRNHCITKLTAKWNKKRQLMVGAFLAESGKTASLALDYVRQASTLFKGVGKRVERRLRRTVVKAERRKARGRKFTSREFSHEVKKLLDFATQEWIKLNFGLAPLVDDLGGLALSTLRFKKKARQKSKIRFAARDSIRKVASNPGITIFNFTGAAYSVTRVRSVEVHIKMLTMVALDPTEGALNAALGGDVRTIAPTIWELIPWSWLADYVSNAGDIIDTFSSFGFSTSATQTTQVVEVKDKQTYGDASSISAPYRVMYHSMAPGSDTLTRTMISRDQTSGVPLPQFTFSYDLSPKKMSMVAAVAWQQLVAKRVRNLTTRLMAAG